MCDLHAMEYYLALRKKEILTRATTRMNSEDMMLSKISQSPKDRYPRSPLTLWHTTESEILGTERRMVVAKG